MPKQTESNNPANKQHQPSDSSSEPTVFLQYKKLTQLNWGAIVMIEPFYKPDKRNGSRVHYIDGSYDNTRYRPDYVLEQLAMHHCTSVDAARERAAMTPFCTSQRKVNLVLSDEHCFVPLRCGDVHNCGSTLGYVSAKHVWRVEPTEQGGTRLQFHPTHKGVEIQQKFKSTYSSLENGRIMLRYWKLQQDEYRSQTAEQHNPSNPIGDYW